MCRPVFIADDIVEVLKEHGAAVNLKLSHLEEIGQARDEPALYPTTILRARPSLSKEEILYPDPPNSPPAYEIT